MTLEFICNGYDKKNYDETTYSITLSAEKDYDEYFKKLLADGKLTAHNSNETINVALRELSWFKNFIFRHVTAINEKHSYLYLVMLEWSTEDDDGVNYYLYHDYTAAKNKYNRLIEDENDADISWIGSEVFDEIGNVNKGYHFDCSEKTDKEQNLCWRVADLNDFKRFSIITLTKVEIL